MTPGGFCECLQGSTAMGRGIVVLSGTGEIIDERVKCQLSAVFRRIHREAYIGWMSKQDICSFFRQFLTRFVPACAEAEWARWEQVFMVDDGPWSSRDISIDMLKQFLMHQITEASCSTLGDVVPAACAGTNEFNVRVERKVEFFQLVCSGSAAEAFLNSYSPVQVHVASSERFSEDGD